MTKVGWGLGTRLRLLPTKTCPLSQGWALAEDPDWVLDGCPRAGKPTSPGPHLLAWVWTSQVEGGALKLDPFLSELRAAIVLGGGLQEHHDLTSKTKALTPEVTRPLSQLS